MASPLPPAWSEHLGPNGIPYYHNAITKESTYVRPVQVIAQPAQPAAKKEKAHLKAPIPGTDWIRVTTTEGNVFYNNKVTKQSVWTVPDDLKAALEAFQAQELKATQAAAAPAESKGKSAASAKRKAEKSVPVDEVIISKKSKVEEENEESEEDEDEDEDEEEEEDEEWQREAAAQLAAEAEEEKKKAEERAKEAELEAQRTRDAIGAAIPQRVEMSIEEGKALFKTLLREKDINPLHPWDLSLPKFIQDPRYVLLPSVAARREAFDEYCKERAREIRQSTVKKEKEALSPKDEYEKLLKDEVKSTRASWTDFRRTWKKDRRFYGWGRDDREREKRFRDFLKDLGEQKRAAAEKAEANFFSLLKENVTITEDITWKEVKNRKIIYKDPRYDAVGSSSLREELFNTFVKGKVSQSTGEQGTSLSIDAKESSKDGPVDRQERRNKAVKEREEKINAERRRLDADIQRSKQGVDREEGERIFMTLLTDAIREPQATWEQSLPQLKTDPRFTNSPLPLNRQVHLFHTHLSHLRAKQLANLHGLFEAHAASLATKFNALPLDAILASAPVTRLGFTEDQLEGEFEKWQRERTTAARAAFDEMMSENAFVEFWGRLGKIGGEGVSGGLKLGGEDIGEAAEEEEKVDMKALAKSVDIREMEKVLKNDKRYIMFDHVPDQRERWLREYLSNLSAPKLSVHVNNN